MKSEGVFFVPEDQGEEGEDFLFYQVRIDVRVLLGVKVKNIF